VSLINGISGLGSGLTTFAGNAEQDAASQATRAPLLNSAAPAATAAPDAALAAAGPAPAQAAQAALATASDANPYTGPHAAALWQAEQSIKGPESGGKADAQNPVSSAGGLFQITNPTWDAAVRKMGLPVASSDAERDTQKYQPELNTAVMRTINTQAAAALDAANLPVNVQTLQAAHRLGSGGAAEAIKTAMVNPNAPLVGNGLAPDAVRGNGDISRMTVGQFLSAPYPKAGA
jgi:hypothetical protein